MSDSKSGNFKGYLEIFGAAVDQNGGVRALAVSDAMHHTDPVDDMSVYVGHMESVLGSELTMEGMNSEKELERFVEACWELRAEYGHEVWIRLAYADYLELKGLSSADANRKTNLMLWTARSAFVPILAEYEDQQNRATILDIERKIEILTLRLAELRAAAEVVASYKRAA